jgi:hypothetical protein
MLKSSGYYVAKSHIVSDFLTHLYVAGENGVLLDNS